MKKRELKFNPVNLHYTGVIGTGGIGTGKFFQLNGNQTLGREESRSGHFLNVNDYCKQHIILHYVRVLLGTSFSVIPVGKVGDDDFGNNLLNEMSATGFVMNHIEKVINCSTLFSFCFFYPDGSGGNLTTDNSASSLIDITTIENVAGEIKEIGSKGIIMAAPEVPLKARQYLIELGKQNNLFCAASFTTEEMPLALEAGILSNVDLIALNIDEASSITGNSYEETELAPLVEHAIIKLQHYNKNIMVSVTAGKKGSWCWDGQTLNVFPSAKTEVKSTAGAGDAFFSGLLCGRALGLKLEESQQLATLIAGLSVQSPHTIHKGIDRSSLRAFIINTGLTFSEKIIKLLED